MDDQLPYNSNNKVLDKTTLNGLLSRFGVTVPAKDIKMYQTAMIHKSYCTRKNENIINGNEKCPKSCIPLQEVSNERLEFLGDSVLNLAVASYLYERYPTENEGFMTTMRTKLVNGTMLATLASMLNIGEWVILSKQIDDKGGRKNNKILEDVLEAFIGAIYLDFDERKTKTKNLDMFNGLGYQYAKTWIINLIEENIDFCQLLHTTNYKDVFFKYYNNNFKCSPNIQDISGSRGKTNECVVCVKDNTGNIIAVGRGSTKKLAESEASKKALEFYGQVTL